MFIYYIAFLRDFMAYGVDFTQTSTTRNISTKVNLN